MFFNELIESVSSYSNWGATRFRFSYLSGRAKKKYCNLNRISWPKCHVSLFLHTASFLNTLCAANFPPDLPLCSDNPCSPFTATSMSAEPINAKGWNGLQGLRWGRAALGQTYRVGWQDREGGVEIQKALIRPIMALTVETRVRN